MSFISIDGRKIGSEYPPYIIAEVSGNHNGKLEDALRLLDVAAQAGADAVKLQTYTADTLTIDHNGKDFKIEEGLWTGSTLYELYEKAHTPWEWHAQLFSHAKKLGLTIFSSPFDETAIDFLQSLGAPAFKIASFELVDLELVRYAASMSKPLLMSTGMASKQEIGEALEAARSTGAQEILLFHCVSGYPTPASESNLKTILDLAQSFQVPIGLSDHTLGATTSITAITLGACAIEKHFTLSRSEGGVDAAFSLEPEELQLLVTASQDAWNSIGDISYDLKPSEVQNKKFRRSIYVVKDMKAGERFTRDNVKVIRPGYGMAPKELTRVLAMRAACDLSKGTALREDALTL